MMFGNSRYASAGTYTVTDPTGRAVPVVRVPAPRTDPIVGYHRRLEGQRLDHIAAHYLNDATTFWRLCDANDALVPDALATAETVGVPRSGS